MKHYEFYRRVPGTDPVQIQEKIWKTFRKLDDELDWLNKPVVFRAAEGGKSSYDLMAVVEIDGEERLDEYLAHPLTQKLEGKLEGAVADKAAFDHY